MRTALVVSEVSAQHELFAGDTLHDGIHHECADDANERIGGQYGQPDVAEAQGRVDRVAHMSVQSCHDEPVLEVDPQTVVVVRAELTVGQQAAGDARCHERQAKEARRYGHPVDGLSDERNRNPIGQDEQGYETNKDFHALRMPDDHAWTSAADPSDTANELLPEHEGRAEYCYSDGSKRVHIALNHRWERTCTIVQP